VVENARLGRFPLRRSLVATLPRYSDTPVKMTVLFAVRYLRHQTPKNADGMEELLGRLLVMDNATPERSHFNRISGVMENTVRTVSIQTCSLLLYDRRSSLIHQPLKASSFTAARSPKQKISIVTGKIHATPEIP
jgi:hypothetical protein